MLYHCFMCQKVYNPIKDEWIKTGGSLNYTSGVYHEDCVTAYIKHIEDVIDPEYEIELRELFAKSIDDLLIKTR